MDNVGKQTDDLVEFLAIVKNKGVDLSIGSLIADALVLNSA
jgi:hypothetical protein